MNAEALSERERLQVEYRSAQSAADLHAANVGRAEQRLRRLTLERAAGYKAQARGQDDRVDSIEQELADVEAELERERHAGQGALEARREVEGEMARLHREYLADFAEEAEQLSEQAREALVALAEPYKAAEEAWSAASAKWRPLAAAIEGQVKECREADGIYSAGRGDADASRVPDWPLPSSGSIFGAAEAGALSARPKAVQPAPAD